MSAVRSDHRFWMKLISVMGGKVEPRRSELDEMSRVFLHFGGSWERVFNGSPLDIALLRRILKVGIKHEVLTRKEKWS